jgi:hypothetical protein
VPVTCLLSVINACCYNVVHTETCRCYRRRCMLHIVEVDIARITFFIPIRLGLSSLPMARTASTTIDAKNYFSLPISVGNQRALIVRKVLRFRVLSAFTMLLRRKDGVCITGDAHLHCKKVCTVKGSQNWSITLPKSGCGSIFDTGQLI